MTVHSSTVFKDPDTGRLYDAWDRDIDEDDLPSDEEVSNKDDEAEALREENEELKRQLAAMQAEYSTDDDYESMKVDGEDGLKAELKRRREAGREFDTSSINTKADLIAALRADDQAQAAEEQE